MKGVSDLTNKNKAALSEHDNGHYIDFNSTKLNSPQPKLKYRLFLEIISIKN